MNIETQFQEKCKDDFQWANALEGVDGFAALSQAGACDKQYHQLMIFTGLNAGANMSLAEGTYSLGRSFECDIVLKDPGIEPVHLILICHPDTITLRPEIGTVYLDGQLVNSERVLPEPPVVITIAGVHFGLAVDGAGWYPLDFPRIEEVVPPPKEAPKEQVGGDGDPVSDPSGAADVNISKTAIGRLPKVNALSKVATVSFILLFIVSALFLFRGKTVDNESFILKIEQQFNAWQLPKPTTKIDAEGFLDITAYAPSVPRKEQIDKYLQSLQVAVRPHIYSDDQVDRALQDYISKMLFSIEAVYQGNGRALVKGFVENQEDADLMESLLKSNVMGLRTVTLKVRQMEKVLPTLTAILKQAALTDKINLRPQSGHLLAEGTLDVNERARWQTAKKEIFAQLGRPLDIVDQISDRELIESIPGKIDIPIAGVTVQPYPFITLQDGKVYFEGASLQNGTIIKDIGSKRIIVEIEGQDYYYNF